MDIDKIKKSASILYQARIRLEKLSKLPNECIPSNKEEGYKIQDSLAELYLSNIKNTKIIGKKVGCTNKEAQKQINVDEPFYGNIFSTFSSKNNSVLNRNDFLQPFIEPEFSFKIKNEFNINTAPYSAPYPFTINEVYESIDSILPSIEIVDSRFKDWTTIGINNLIADNAVNAHWVFGDENNNIKQFNLSDYPVNLNVNNKLIHKGNSNKVLSHPFYSLTWLINTMVLQGKTLPKNSYISTGTCTPALPVNIHDTISADFGALGIVKFKLI